MNSPGADILSLFRNKAPVPLGPQFPPSLAAIGLPPVMEDYAHELSESLQVPYEMVLCNLFGVLSAASQRKFCVQVKEGYCESLNLYLLSPLPPGERKSAVTQAVRKSLQHWENEQEGKFGPLAQEAQSKRLTLERAIEHRRNQAARAKTVQARNAMWQEIQELEAELPEPVHVPRLLADDITPECLAQLMEQQGECLAVIEAEGGLFDTFAGRYSQMPNLDLILKAFSGEPCRVDRKHGQHIGLNHPLLTICVTTQPDVLRSMASNSVFRGRGFLARFLFFYGKSRLGFRLAEPPSVAAATEQAFSTKIESLLSLRSGTGDRQPQTLTLTPGAYEIWKDFFYGVEAQLRPGQRLEHLTDWAGKLPGQVVRLAGLLHLASSSSVDISLDSSVMQAAAALGNRLTGHALFAFHDMGCDEPSACARNALDWIKGRHVERFSLRDCQRAIRGRFPKKKQIQQGIGMLEEHGYIVSVPVPSSGPGRPPGSNYVVHPAVHAAASCSDGVPSQPTQRDTYCFATCVPVGAGEGGKPPFDPSFNAREKEAV